MHEEEDPTFQISIKGSLYRDRDLLRDFAMLSEYRGLLHEISEKIRSRLKYGEGPISDTDVKLLEDIRSDIWELTRD